MKIQLKTSSKPNECTFNIANEVLGINYGGTLASYKGCKDLVGGFQHFLSEVLDVDLEELSGIPRIFQTWAEICEQELKK